MFVLSGIVRVHSGVLFWFSFFSLQRFFKFVFSLIYCNIIALAFIGGGGEVYKIDGLVPGKFLVVW